MIETDVIVVGSGPAGSSAAKHAALGGAKVILMDKKSEIGSPKRCAEGVSIEGLEKLKGFKYSKTSKDNYIQYTDECNHAHWYEVEGIDLGMENVEKTFQTIADLSEEGLSAVIYCVSAITGRIEEIEKELISRIENSFAEIKVMVVLTMCYKDNIQETIDEIEKITNQAKLVVTLAKEYKTGLKDNEGNAIMVEPFGLEWVSEYVFEGR